MRKELLTGSTTITKLAKRCGVTHQRIQQLVGPLNGESRRKRLESKVRRVVELEKLGMSDEQIAKDMKISIGYARMLRLRVGIHRPNPRLKWTRAKVVDKALEWYQRYGYTPAASDWNPAYTTKRGDFERAARFYESGAPYLNTVRQLFGNWSEMIKEAGLTPASKGRRFINGLPNRDM